MSKIMVVDDEAVIRELLQDILTGEGYEVDTMPNAKAALETLAKSNGYVLLFTDIMMPEMDGITLIREARKLAPSMIPIVMTGFATLETARAAVKEGAYDYVLKPFSLTEIKLAVTNAIERYQLSMENSRLREINDLFTISECIAGFREERELLNYVLEAALDRVQARRGSLMLLTPDGQALEIAASVGLPEEARREPIAVGRGIAGWVAMNGRPLLVENIKRNPELINLSRRLQNASFISVPLERKNPHQRLAPGEEAQRVLAVLNVTDKISGQPFSDSDLKMLSIMANQASAALENVRLIGDIERAHLTSLESMARLLEAKDAYTHGHSERVRDYCVMAARQLGLPPPEIETLRLGAMLHDIGKVGVHDGVLNKLDPLTDDEWQMIKLHPVIGYDILKPVHTLSQQHLAIVRSHHERLDGSGYPDGLTAAELNPALRIICVADSYDAMASSRAYRPGLPAEAIMQELQHCIDHNKLDPDVASLFIKLIQSGEIEEARQHYAVL